VAATVSPWPGDRTIRTSGSADTGDAPPRIGYAAAGVTSLKSNSTCTEEDVTSSQGTQGSYGP
jgi:hypothetical protein